MKTYPLYYAAAAILIMTAGSQAKDRNLSISSSGDAQTCADLKAKSSNGEVAQAVDKFTLQRREAPVLEVVGNDSGVISVFGWDRAEYSVETCKFAVAGDRAAGAISQGRSVSHSAGRVMLNGLASDDANWQVHFLVHAEGRQPGSGDEERPDRGARRERYFKTPGVERAGFDSELRRRD